MKKLKLLMIALFSLFLCEVASAQSRDQFKTILNDFCLAYYEDAFSGKQYMEGTLTITAMEVDESSEVIKIRGKHSYRGQYIPIVGRQTHSNVDYKAEVSEANNGLRIKFWKWYEPDVVDPKGHWEGPCTKIIIP